ncbi:MAG: rhodanese-like domain-containing protein [Thermodesulfovibrionales bacterium]|nr:rhodanese-like domain-containing protein [Thermodesulfovibrionales bacterium]
MGLLDSVSYQAETIQLDLAVAKEIVKFDDSTKVKNMGSIEDMNKYKGKAFQINFVEKKGKKVATNITRFDILKTIKPEDKLSKEDFKKLIAERKDLVIVDARPVPRYEEGHIPGAIVIPAAAFEKMTDKLPKEKDRTMVFYCVGGCSSPLAAVKAKSLGYTNVKVYIGGFPDWIQTETTNITPSWLKTAIEKDIPHVLVDTRPKDAVEKGHIKGAVAVAVNELDSMKDKFPQHKMAPIVFYGERAEDAAKKAISWGYKGTRLLPMSFEAWKAAGNPISSGPAKTAIVYVPKPKPGTVLPSDFKKIAANLPPDVIIIDVRDADEYATGHVKGSKNIPLDELADRFAEIPKDKRLVLYCDTGLRAEMGYHLLKENGFQVACLDSTIKIDKTGTFSIQE